MTRFILITPTQGARYSILKCVESVITQTHQDYIHMVGIDGVKDFNPDVISKLPRDNKHVVFYEHTRVNTWGHNIRRSCLTCTTIQPNDYIIYLDDDNYLAYADALSDLNEIIELTKHDVILFPQLRLRNRPPNCVNNIFIPKMQVLCIDIGSFTHRAYIKGCKVEFTKSEAYEADGFFCEELAKLTNSIYLYDCPPIIVYN